MLALVTLVGVAAVILVNWRRSGRQLGPFLGLGLLRVYARLFHGCVYEGQMPIPRTGAGVVISNHTCSSDGTFIQGGCPRRGLTYLFAEEFDRPLFRWIWATTACIPVRRGRYGDVGAARTALRRLQEGRVLVVFPEGNLSGSGLGRLRTAKCGAAYLALRARVPVFPVWISGGPEGPNVRRAWFWPSRARVTFGEPIDLAPFHDRRLDRRLLEQVTLLLMQKVAATAPGKK